MAHGTSCAIASASSTSVTGGGAFAAYVDGERVVDIWSGDAAPGVAWSEDTAAVVMSATKGLTAVCAHVLHDRGELDLDAPVDDVLAGLRRRGQGRRRSSATC